MRTRMFPFITCTWNPIVGCLHDCVYCWARKLAETKLKSTERYRYGFKPQFLVKELGRRFKKGDTVFVSDMGDAFGDWVKEQWIAELFNVIRRNELTTFFCSTKNPSRYTQFFFPENVIRAATIETNREIPPEISRAPQPKDRLNAMIDMDIWDHPTFLSVEPIMDFDLDEFSQAIIEINPSFGVAVGYDNYNNHLPEPSLEKTEQLIAKLETVHIKVFRKTIRERCKPETETQKT